VDLSDAEIMSRVQRGHRELFEVLVRRYRLALLRVAESRLGDRTLAEDVVQEAFLAAYAARDTYRPAFAFRTWLWTILLNLCSKQWQRRQSRREVTAALTEPPMLQSHETGLSVALGVERREQVHACLARLPDVQADALRLRFFGELSFSEIAAVMGSSLGAAKMRVKNGLQTLSEQLRREQNDEERNHDLR
jgi:RNA polymerase sigma-70 factor (ECF subfamily)